MISQPVVEQVIMVVSEIGDAWSPKILPPNIAPATNGMLLPMEYAIGSAMQEEEPGLRTAGKYWKDKYLYPET